MDSTNPPSKQGGEKDLAKAGRITYGEIGRVVIFVALMVISEPLLQRKSIEQWIGVSDDSWQHWLFIAVWALFAVIVTYCIWGLLVRAFGKRA